MAGAVDAQERLSQWAKANLVANKLLAKSPPTAPYYVQYLHYRIAENFNRLAQHVNAVESWKRALAVPNTPPRPDIHMPDRADCSDEPEAGGSGTIRHAVRRQVRG